ncbi:hypothetical protein HDU97_002434 [Phlyctochytrium planicorne]|nr:hypothetical protein HDU97_002434 [Phlyctochytrium planicorne]
MFGMILSTINNSWGPIKVGSLCLQNNGASQTMTVEGCSGESNQMFKAAELGGGIIIKTADNNCVNILGAKTAANSAIGTYACINNAATRNQIFIPTVNSLSNGGQVSLFSDSVTMCMTAQSVAAGKPVLLGYCIDAASQKWVFPLVMPASSTAIYATSPSGKQLCLQTYPDTSVGFRPCYEGLIAQQWQYDFGFTINAAFGSKRCLTAGDGNMYTDVCGYGSEQLLILGANNKLIFGNGYQCLGFGGSEYDAILKPCSASPTIGFNRKTLLIDEVPTNTCALQGTRKEWRKQTAAEKTAYINAVNKLRSTASTSGRANRYIDLVAIHSAAAGYIHMTPLFLPWHRAFLRLYENLLRKIDPTVSLPYWDWSSDSPNPMKSSTISQVIGSATTALGTRGTATSGYCLRDGIAANWKSSEGGCVTRSYASDFTSPSQIDVAIAVQRDPTFEAFAGDLEYFHNLMHGQIGGDNGMMSWTNLSPNDNIFFFHHTNVDRLWYSWQQYHTSIQSQYTGSYVLPDGTTTNVKVTDWMPSFNIPVSGALTLGNGGQCTGYDTIDKTKITRRDVTPIEERGLLPWLDTSLPNFVSGALQFARKKHGSGKHGTIPLPPMPGLAEWFVRRNMGTKLFGKPNSAEEDDRNIRHCRAMESRISTHRAQFIELLDKYFEEHPGAEYEDAFIYALTNLEILEPAKKPELSSNVNGGTVRNGTGSPKPANVTGIIAREELDVQAITI